MTSDPAGDRAWEHAERPGGRRWAPVTVGVALTIVALVAVAATRTGSSGTLAVMPSPSPSAPAPRTDDVGETDEDATATDAPGDPTSPTGTRSETAGVAAATPGPLLPDAASLTVVTATSGGLRFSDLATGSERVVRLPNDRGGQTRPLRVATVGDHLVVTATAGVLRLDHDGGGRHRIAPDGRALRSASPSSVWVIDTPTNGSAGTAIHLDMDGTELTRVRVPAVARPIVGTDDGLLVATASGATLVTGDGGHPLPIGSQPLASDGTRLAWLDCTADLRCAVVIGTLDDPGDGPRLQLAAEELPGGYLGLSGGVFSPDGTMFALPLFQVDPRRGVRNTAVVVVDTAGAAELARLPGSRVRGFDTALIDWAPDGRWMLFAGGTGLSAWRAGDGRVVELPAPTAPILSLAVLGPAP